MFITSFREQRNSAFNAHVVQCVRSSVTTQSSIFESIGEVAMNKSLNYRHFATAGRLPAQQRGVGFVTLILYFVVAGVLLLGGLKLMPHYIEYFSIKKVMSAMASSEEVKSGTVAEIRSSFDRRATIDSIAVIKGSDLEISKENNETVVTAAWQPRITIITGYTLLIDFSISTADK